MSQLQEIEPSPPLARAARRGRPPRVDRDRLLRVARELLSREGYGVSMAQIALHAGVAEGTLYLHFRGKEDLISAVIARFYDELYPEMRAIAQRPGPAGARLTAMISRHLRIYEDDPGFARLLLGLVRTLADYAASDLCRLNARHAGLFAQVIADGVSAGTFGPAVDVRVARDVILGALDYHTWLAAMTGRMIDADRDARAIASICLGGLKAACEEDRP